MTFTDANLLINLLKVRNMPMWRAKKAEQLMQFDDKIPIMLYNSSVLCKAKQEESYKRLDVKSNIHC